MAQAQYHLKVTAGTGYDQSTHQKVEVNGGITTLGDDWCASNLAVRIQNYHDDMISISFSIVFRHDINGNDLLFGNDFDHPIRHKLPSAFKVMEMMVKKYIDPAIEIDAYSDTPSTFSPVLASASQFRISYEDPDENVRLHRNDIVLEGSDTKSGEEILKEQGVPDSPKRRREHFQSEANREAFWFFGGIQYCVDFSNAYLNVSDLCLNLPGFSLPVHHLVDSETHQLRYTLKNKVTGQVFLVVVISLDLSETEAENLEGELDATQRAQKLKDDTALWKNRMRGWY